jgi:hypothetical protein
LHDIPQAIHRDIQDSDRGERESKIVFAISSHQSLVPWGVARENTSVDVSLDILQDSKAKIVVWQGGGTLAKI